MYLIHKSTIKNSDGVIDIDVIVVNEKTMKPKQYTYHLSSEYAAKKFHSLYTKGKKLHGTALNLLNKFKIKDGDGNE